MSAALEWTALGLPIETDADSDLVQPLSVAVVIKGLDSAGAISYWVSTSSELTGVEALGMFTWGAKVAEDA